MKDCLHSKTNFWRFCFETFYEEGNIRWLSWKIGCKARQITMTFLYIYTIFCKVEKVTCKVDMRSWQTEKNVCSIGQFIYQIGNSVCNVGKIIFRIWKSVCKVWKLICHTWTSFCKVENIICQIWKSVCKRDETPDRTECLHCRKDYCKVGLIGKIFKHFYWHQHKV